jgi:hypothetical protein
MANAKLEWTPTGGSRQSYTLPVNFTYDYQELGTDDGDRERALDGTLRSYARDLKARWVLRFQYIGAAQKEQLALLSRPRWTSTFSGRPGPQDLHGGVDQRPGFPGGVAGAVVRQPGAGGGLGPWRYGCLGSPKGFRILAWKF